MPEEQLAAQDAPLKHVAEHVEDSVNQDETIQEQFAGLCACTGEIDRKLELWLIALADKYGPIPETSKWDHPSFKVLDYLDMGEVDDIGLFCRSISILLKCAGTYVSCQSITLLKTHCGPGWQEQLAKAAEKARYVVGVLDEVLAEAFGFSPSHAPGHNQIDASANGNRMAAITEHKATPGRHGRGMKAKKKTKPATACVASAAQSKQ